ncbi:type II toxin-antitoxin system death-on-curing family toxin [Streptomyces sp. HK10]|uniref:type II toxin-antitoxin system death-on-curing family toxin n=1 Tax=Streptomyces sp. HK10 TaxID=3373255 RepID=UPI003747F2EB
MSQGLPGPAVLRPQSRMFGIEAYPGPFGKAAAPPHSPVSNRPSADGDKRPAWVCTAVLLDMNGVDTADVDQDRAYGPVTDVASGKPEDASLIADFPPAPRADV